MERMPKDLREEECFVLMGFILVVVHNVHAAIDQFQFSGQVNVVMKGSP